MIRRRRFAEVVTRQLDIFLEDNAQLVWECEEAERAYNQASRETAEERYGEYVDVVETATELLADLRDHFASSLGEDAAEEYEATFNQAVLKRLPRFALEIEDR